MYGAPDDVYRLLGPERTKAIWAAGQLAGDTLTAAIAEDLVRAAGDMDDVFQRSGYTVPIDPTILTDTTLRAQLVAVLAFRNAVIAISFQECGVEALPPGVVRQIETTARWLDNILTGAENLLGLDRQPAEAQKLVAGRIGFAGSGEPQLERHVFSRWSHLFGGGGSRCEEHW
jgi:hypothetical protein